MSSEDIHDVTLSLNHASEGDTNRYGDRNALLETRRKAQVCYKNGITAPRTSALRLRRNAELAIDHSEILGRNIKAATGKERHLEADSHHIVARLARRADGSRKILFKSNIGINDADNGMYLRRTWDSRVPGQKRATAHQNLHSPKYHDAVLLELSLAFRAGTHTVRPTLQNIKSKILADTFDY